MRDDEYDQLSIFDPPPVDRERGLAGMRAGARERERVLNTMEASHRRVLILQLRNHAAAICRAERRPVSTNDIRDDLAETDYRGDPRILGAVFRGPAWAIVGQTKTDVKRGHAHPIRLFMLTETGEGHMRRDHGLR